MSYGIIESQTLYYEFYNKNDECVGGAYDKDGMVEEFKREHADEIAYWYVG